MLMRDFLVQNEVGLHARPASVITQKASKFKSEIFIRKGSIQVNAKSILSLLTLGARKGDLIQLLTDGIDEEEAMETIIALLEDLKD